MRIAADDGVSRVLCGPSFPVEAARAGLEALARVEEGAPPWSGDDVEALLTFEPVSAEDVVRLPSLRVIATPSVGFDHVDVVAASARGVWVCNVPDYCVDEMADHSLALLLSLVRGVVELDRSVRDGRWEYDAAGPLRRVQDVRLGIVGFGRIGRAVAQRALALGMDVGAHDPFLADDEIVAAGARPLALPELLEASDAVSIHAPLTPDTQGLLGAAEIARLPRGALVVNAARPGLVDTPALLAALDGGQLGGVALDVLDVEPPTTEEPAPASPRLVVNPHAGWYSERADAEVVARSIESVRDVLEGRRPRTAINEPTR
ncbi:MAG TPA: C-terminal binding protein [Gaiellaceae bacterium]|nr:C-terminal binding protein [Gaiellaceae bacterium]